MGKLIIKLLDWVLKRITEDSALTSDELCITPEQLGFVDDLWGYFALVGIGFTLIYFLLEVNRKYAFESTDLTIKTFAVPFIKLVAAIVVLGNAKTIVHSLVDMGNSFIKDMDNFNPGKEAIVDLKDTLNAVMGKASFMLALLLILPSIGCWIITIVCQLVWKYKAIGYKIELLFRVGISPIALADIYSGQNSQAIKWCKGLLATVLYGASFILVVKLGNALAISEISKNISAFNDVKAEKDSIKAVWDLFTAMLGFLIVPIAEIGCISAIRQALKEALA